MIPENARVDLRHENGTANWAWLDEPVDIEGVPCAAWFVDFHENGRLEMAVVARPCVVRGWELVPHDMLYLRDDGALHIVHFDPPRTVAGRTDVASVRFDDGEQLATYTVGDATYDVSGLLLGRWLEDDTVAEISGVVCEGSVELHPNGHVHQTTLGAPLDSRHGTLPARSHVELDERGELTTAIVFAPCTLGGRAFAANDRVVFTGETPVKDEHAWTFYTPYTSTEPEPG